jgi:hypothetical protein
MNVTRRVLGVLSALILAAVTAGAADPSVVAVPGKPILLLANFDLGPLGYQAEEFFVSGTATWFKQNETPAAAAANDGTGDVRPVASAPYTTRLVVVRPTDAAKFSGTVVVEWLNVTGGLDVPVEWVAAHREIIRRGHAYVGVTAQKAGIDGGVTPPLDPRVAPLKKADPRRYGPLDHPGDAYAFDLFSQAGNVVKNAATNKLLGPLVPRTVIGAGESQSAMFLTTYVTAVDPLARVYDGFLIHSRYGVAAPLHGAVWGALVNPNPTRLRPDLRVPVITLIMENDLVGWPPLLGYHAARQPETNRLRVWEVAGTAHADNYTFTVGFLDSGSLPTDQLAAAFAPTRNALGGRLEQPMNWGPQHHYVTEAALWQLDRWVKSGEAPPKAAPLKLAGGDAPKLVTDANGLAEGGVRTPWVDMPTAVLSGVGNAGGPLAGMVGLGRPFDAATLQRLYPGGKDDYLKKFKASLDKTIAEGFILPDDKAEILAVAALSFGAPPAARPADPPVAVPTR